MPNVPHPPLGIAWRSTQSLSMALATGSTLYGVSDTGSIMALANDSGAARWQTSATYLLSRLASNGTTVYGYQKGNGLVAIDDQGTTFSERTLLSISTLDETTPVSQPVFASGFVHFIKGTRLTAVRPASGGAAFDVPLGDEGPYSLYALDGDLLVVSGAGRPSRWKASAASYASVWDTGTSGGSEFSERAALVTDSLVVTAEAVGIAAYSKNTGTRLWSAPGAGTLAFTAQGEFLYGAGPQAALRCYSMGDGSVRWDRQYLAFSTGTYRAGLVTAQNHLWVGVLMDDGAEPAALFAVNLDDGSFAWQATAFSLQYGIGLPLAANGRLYTYGSSDPVTAMGDLAGVPAITVDQIGQNPNPLRGPMSNFTPIEVSLHLPVAARVALVLWHERDDRSTIGPIDYSAGSVTINYDGRWPKGWTEINQFGRLAVEIQERTSGLAYSQVLLVPVNTLPDIQHHWAKRNIEIMLYNRFIGGYPDLTFRADNLVTRAESSTIIAKTLGYERPSAGFQTKFTDIADHWARNYIMALEEHGVVGGFQEPDGTFTYRPNLNMNRAEEARILVRAYAIPAAPSGFTSKFTDIAGHWAENDIKALEARGYVNGFREANGSYTYRPQQNLTRAELCTVVVRVRNLTR